VLAACNDEKSSNGAVSSRVLVATMKAQQAVAIRFVGRHGGHSSCLFFDSDTPLRGFTSLRDMSLRRNRCAVAAPVCSLHH
jgi:acetoacetate decarboxylase